MILRIENCWLSKLTLEEWRHWLDGSKHPFEVITDHRNLEYLHEAKRLNTVKHTGLSSSFDSISLLHTDLVTRTRELMPFHVFIILKLSPHLQNPYSLQP